MQHKPKHCPGKRIKNYTLIQVIGSGGYGKVYKAERDGMLFAIKIVAQSTFQNSGGRVGELHKTEVEHMKQIKSPFVVLFVEYFQQNKFCYIVMEFCNQGDMEHLLQVQVQEDVILRYIRQIIIGMKELHQHGLIHRDLKIKNILLHDNNIKIGDLGFSGFIGVGSSNIGLGMLGYMAPEVMQLQDYSYEADIFSLGCLVFLLLNKKLPYSDVNHIEFLKDSQKQQHQHGDYSNQTKQLIDRMLKYNSKDRITWQELYEF